MRKPPPIAEKARECADEEADAHDPRRVVTVKAHVRLACPAAPHGHGCGDHDHQHTEQEEKLLPIGIFADRGTDRRADDAANGKYDRYRPIHIAAPGMVDHVDEGVQTHCDGAGADGDVGRLHADDVDQQRHREDRSAAADHAENEAHHGPGQNRQQIGDIHRAIRSRC